MKRLLPICLLIACAGLALCAAKVKPPGRWTARQAREFIGHKVYDWDHGAQLILVSSRPFDFGLDGKSSRWGYRYISGDGKSCAVFSVDMAHPNAPVRVSKNARRPPQCEEGIDDYYWKIDSPEACAIAKPNGLDTWLAKHPTFDPTYSGNRCELAANPRDGSYWLMSCAAKPTPTSRRYDRITLTISASTGRLLSRTTTP
jgi:hypothetical protein